MRTIIPLHRGRAMRIPSLALAFGGLVLVACTEPTRPNLNNPSVTDFSTITTLAQVQALAVGVLRGDRPQNENEILYGETIGRDAFRITASEPRFVTELLGPSIDPSDFLGGALWPYATIRLANIGIHGTMAAPAILLSDADKAATVGYLQTLKALLYLRIAETHDTAGAAINVDIPPTDSLAPLGCKNDVIRYIVSLLDSAAANLAAGGAEFPFSLPSGFAGFDTPASFLKFNRALAAKANLYIAFRDYAASGTIDQTALTAASAALDASFMTRDASQLELGPKHTYSTNTGDVTNGLFEELSSTAYRVNPRVLREAEANDRRVAEKIDSVAPISVGGTAPPEQVSSPYVFTLYLTPTTPVSIITNKELLLLKAEVEWGKGNLIGPGSAMDFANFIRTNDGGLPADVSSTTAAAVLNRILYEKRYSLLWQSGARWIDARLFGKLNGNNPPAGIGMERGYPPLANFPIPQNERIARGNNLDQQCTTS